MSSHERNVPTLLVKNIFCSSQCCIYKNTLIISCLGRNFNYFAHAKKIVLDKELVYLNKTGNLFLCIQCAVVRMSRLYCTQCTASYTKMKQKKTSPVNSKQNPIKITYNKGSQTFSAVDPKGKFGLFPEPNLILNMSCIL